MQDFVSKRFAKSIPWDERLYRLTCILESIVYFFSIYVIAFLDKNTYAILLSLVGLCSSFYLFMADNSSSKKFVCHKLSLYVMNLLIPMLLFIGHVGPDVIMSFFFISSIIITIYVLEVKHHWVLIMGDIIGFLMCMINATVFNPVSTVHNNIYHKMSTYTGIFLILASNGLLCALIMSYRSLLMEQMLEERRAAHQVQKELSMAKDSFFVNLSHDIRTPLNAIIGTCELMQNKDLSRQIQKNTMKILNNSKALLSITNAMLDFSQIDFVENSTIRDDLYDTEEFLQELFNLLMVQVFDSGLKVYTRVEGDFPVTLRGDHQKIRQFVTVMLSSILHFSEKGCMDFTIGFERKEKEPGTLYFMFDEMNEAFKESISRYLLENESGENCVIRDDIVKLPDTELGFHNCMRLISLLGGTITYNRKKDQTLQYRVNIPQVIENDGSMIAEKQYDFQVLLLEVDEQEKESFLSVMKQFEIRCDVVKTFDEMAETLTKGQYTHVILPQTEFEAWTEFESMGMTGNIRVIIYGDVEDDFADDRNIAFLVRPIHMFTIADALTGKGEEAFKRANRYSPYICPGARILVVDDTEINLTVARGMLEKLQANVTCASSGKECLKLLETESFDLIFMDYMMPEMDGIDTLNHIRKFTDEKVLAIPVVALTANAVSGAREMFMEAGFDDYLSKPIQMKYLYAMTRKMIPEEMVHLL